MLTDFDRNWSLIFWPTYDSTGWHQFDLMMFTNTNVSTTKHNQLK